MLLSVTYLRRPGSFCGLPLASIFFPVSVHRYKLVIFGPDLLCAYVCGPYLGCDIRAVARIIPIFGLCFLWFLFVYVFVSSPLALFSFIQRVRGKSRIDMA
ncbi:hypothetical protein BDW62DRAFT_18589 [Aspergillus aurantiobrunneus]